MTEIIIFLEDIDPVIFFGANNSLLDKIRSFFPKIKIMARGNEINCMGGRTLENAFVIPDEAQNETIRQLKMFLRSIVRAYEKEENETDKTKNISGKDQITK